MINYGTDSNRISTLVFPGLAASRYFLEQNIALKQVHIKP